MNNTKKNIAETETEAVTTTATETVSKKPAAKVKAKQDVMYIGPSIPNVVQASTVFKGGILPEALKKCVEEKPYMKKLLVPIKELPAAMKELHGGKSALSTIYRRVKNEF